MGKPVTVDSDDLKTLLFATGVIKQIEQALVAQSRDPLAKMAKPELTAAHDALARAWQGSVSEPHPDRGRPLRDGERATLEMLAAAGETTIGFRDDSRGLHSLRLAGYVEMGERYAMTVWGDTRDASKSAVVQVVRISELGRDALAGRASWAPAAALTDGGQS